jgi:hypothetical protein
MHIFDDTVKPVLLYASEIVGLFNNNKNVGIDGQKCLVDFTGDLQENIYIPVCVT